MKGNKKVNRKLDADKEMVIELMLPPCFHTQSRVKKLGLAVCELDVANKNKTRHEKYHLSSIDFYKALLPF